MTIIDELDARDRRHCYAIVDTEPSVEDMIRELFERYCDPERQHKTTHGCNW